MTPPMTAKHFLDPLDETEISTAAEAVRAEGGLDAGAWFETITLDEPTRDERAAGAAERRAYVCCYEPSSNRTFRGVVRLGDGRLLDWAPVPGAQARIAPEEFAHGEQVVKADPRFRDALARRGVDDLDSVLVETWSPGNFGDESETGERLAYCHCWVSNAAGDNRYGRPIAGLHPVVDLARSKVVRIDDFGGAPLPSDTRPIRLQDGLRDDVKPLEITQPDGPSFSVDGYAVAWQRWRLRIGYNLREGLVLHDIGYEDNGRLRGIMRRASLAEMVVPYGDPRAGAYRRNAFDTGEYGIGQNIDSLKLGCDCLGHIRYFDIWTHDWRGAPRLIGNAVCMHEEDYGLLWKHTDAKTQTMRAVRSRRLVVSSIATIGNYVYGFFWYFYQDGTIGVEVKATGIPFPNAIAPGEEPRYGEIMAPGVEGHVHQHVFSFRFEMCVDGERNSAQEVDFEPEPVGPGNPHGAGVRICKSWLDSERQAAREMSLERARYWRIVNKESLNGLGRPVAYKLQPGANALPMLPADSPVGRRAGFMYKHFWATQFAADQLYPCGWFPNQNPGGDGLSDWVAADRSLDQTDLVAWYTLNLHHLPRPEDWPVQPVVYANFHWMADGFFDENPALDVPHGKESASC